MTFNMVMGEFLGRAKFSKLSGNMDRMVYDMRQESGVTDAALQILVTDSRNVTIYQYLVD